MVTHAEGCSAGGTARGSLAAIQMPPRIAIGYMALVATPVALLLWIFALNRATPTRVASTMAMHPVGASILAAIIVGEPIGLNLGLGVIAVLAGIWIATREGRPPEQKNEQGQSPARIALCLEPLGLDGC